MDRTEAWHVLVVVADESRSGESPFVMCRLSLLAATSRGKQVADLPSKD